MSNYIFYFKTVMIIDGPISPIKSDLRYCYRIESPEFAPYGACLAHKSDVIETLLDRIIDRLTDKR